MFRHRVPGFAFMAFLFALSTTLKGWAEDAAAGKLDIEERLQQIEARLSQLEKRVDEAVKPLAKETTPAVSSAGAGFVERFEALDQKVRILQRKKELEQDAALVQAKESPVIKAGRDGFQMRSPDGYYQMRFKGNVQSDGRFFVADSTGSATSTFLLRTARPIVIARFRLVELI
jgi:phosphate-selective porin OprO/OprP